MELKVEIMTPFVHSIQRLCLFPPEIPVPVRVIWTSLSSQSNSILFLALIMILDRACWFLLPTPLPGVLTTREWRKISQANRSRLIYDSPTIPLPHLISEWRQDLADDDTSLP